MIRFTQGDILKSDAEALVNTVNCVGVMGRGIALQFKKRFPENFKAYAAACARGELAWSYVRLRNRHDDVAPTQITELSHKTPLAGQKPHRRH